MGTGDGSVIGSTKILDNGSAASRFNIVLVAEGYQSAELSQFNTDAQDCVDQLLATPPFDEMEPAINAYRIDVESDDSGADDPVACGGSGVTADTYFDASFCNGGIRRLLGVNTTTVLNVVNGIVPQWHQIIVIVNSTIWGGAGGTIGTTSTASGWENIAIHEMGHSAFGLADEYDYWAGCGVDTDRDNYTGGEPTQPNITANTNRATIKWGGLIDASTPLPTTSNADCSICDPQVSPVPVGTVGAFEGAGYYHCGLYRPEYSCMMRNLGLFCEVCQERIRETLQPYMPEVIHPEIPERFFDFRLMPDWILERWILVAYLIINWRLAKTKQPRIRPDKAFYKEVAKHLSAYIFDGKKPPAGIEAAIMNLADEYLGGKKMTLRAGDYIAIQNHLRQRR